MAIRQVTSVNGGMPASSPILMNRNDEPQMRASDRNRPQMYASRSDRAAWIGLGAGRVTGPLGWHAWPDSTPDGAHRGGRPERLRRSGAAACTSRRGAGAGGPSTSWSTEALAAGALVVYTQDWHPPSTPHFAKDGGIWPVHCVRDTWGAALAPGAGRPGAGRAQGHQRRGRLQRLHDARPGDAATTMPTELAGAAGGARHRAGRRVRPRHRLLRPGDRARRAAAGPGDHGPAVDLVRAVDLAPGDGERAHREMAAAGVSLEA